MSKPASAKGATPNLVLLAGLATGLALVVIPTPLTTIPGLVVIGTILGAKALGVGASS